MFVGFLAFTAAISIAAVVTGAFNDFVARVLASSASVSAASVCAMACAAYLERGRVRWIGVAGVALAATALAMALVVIWTPSPAADLVKLVLVLVVWTVAFAHAALLLSPQIAPRHGWVPRAAVAAVASLAILATLVVIDGDFGEGFGRLLAVNSILVALLTSVVPVVWKIGGEPARASEERARLVLSETASGDWIDARGRLFSVRPLQRRGGLE